MPKPPLNLRSDLAALHDLPINEHADRRWETQEGVAPIMSALTVGSDLLERLKRTEAAADARADLLALNSRDLQAIALAAIYQFRQDADADVWGDYSQWDNSGPTRPFPPPSKP